MKYTNNKQLATLEFEFPHSPVQMQSYSFLLAILMMVTLLLASAEPESEYESEALDFNKMKTKELKRFLMDRGLSCKGWYECCVKIYTMIIYIYWF
jgi:hypothetical protein